MPLGWLDGGGTSCFALLIALIFPLPQDVVAAVAVATRVVAGTLAEGVAATVGSSAADRATADVASQVRHSAVNTGDSECCWDNRQALES